MTDAWTPSSVEGRWCGLGPYYAMFPVAFAKNIVTHFCPLGGTVLDPFCGRGTTTYVAAVTGRRGIGTDINPVAWLYSSVKLNPCPNPALLEERVERILRAVRKRDKSPQNEFQRSAWSPEVLGFLRVARRKLNWRGNRTDRTLMGIILVHLHAKLGEGLSNQLRQSKSMSPTYAVEWWKSKGMTPPSIDIRKFFKQKFKWRYAKGVPTITLRNEARLGDARRILPQLKPLQADLLFTSPPYYDVTNYEYDNWIRLWMLGGPPLPTYRTKHRFGHSVRYKELLKSTFEAAANHCKNSSTIYVRTDAREFTLNVTEEVLRNTWPKHDLRFRVDRPSTPTQTDLFQAGPEDPGEVDIILTIGKQALPKGFSRR